MTPDNVHKYIRNNFHRLSSWTKASDILFNLRPGESHVLLLEGDEGSGREYFSKALAYNHNNKNQGNVIFTPLDVSANSLKSSISGFQKFLSPKGEKITIKAKIGTPGFIGFSLELLKELKISPESFFQDYHLDIPEDDLYTRIIHLISEIRLKRTVILHLSNFIDISPSILRAILNLLTENSSQYNPLLVTIQGSRGPWKNSLYHGEFFSKIQRWKVYDKLQFEPLDQDEIKTIFDYRFPNRGISYEFYADLKKVTGGIPMELSLTISFLIKENLLVDNLAGFWEIEVGFDFYGEVFRSIKGSKCYFNYKDRIKDPQLKKHIDTFLEYAAVCGEYVPVYTVFESMGILLDIEKRQLSYQIDEYLGEDTDDPILEDLDVPIEFEPLYSNLPEELIYRFIKKWLISLFRLPRQHEKRIAKDLLSLYEKNSGAGRKEQCRILYRLAEMAEDETKIKHYR